MGLIRKIVADVISPSRGALLSFGLLGTLWTCSSGFAAMIEALNVAYDVPETRPFWKTRLLAIELIFIIGTLVTLGLHFHDSGAALWRVPGEPAGHGAACMRVIWPVLRYVVAITFIVHRGRKGCTIWART